MDIKEFIQQKRAVSPVIGVILMVAITVILAAVIGTFVLGLGDQVGESAPSSNFDVEQEINGTNAVDVTFTHSGGESVEGDALGVSYSGDGIDDAYFESSADPSDNQISAGDSFVVVAEKTGGEGIDAELRLSWESGDKSATLRTVSLRYEDGEF